MRSRAAKPSALSPLARGCWYAPTEGPSAVEEQVLPSAAMIPGVTSHEGVLGPGALHQMFVHARWSGALVLYAHGYFVSDGPPRIWDPLRGVFAPKLERATRTCPPERKRSL
jgi:hypothetical protein